MRYKSQQRHLLANHEIFIVFLFRLSLAKDKMKMVKMAKNNNPMIKNNLIIMNNSMINNMMKNKIMMKNKTKKKMMLIHNPKS